MQGYFGGPAFTYWKFSHNSDLLVLGLSMNTRVWNFVCTAALIVVFSGCGDSGPKIVKVAGKATYKGKPLPRLILTFSPDTGRPSTAMTDAEGNFDLEYEGTRKGAQVGNHTVTVEYRPKDPGEEMEILEGRKKRPPEIEAIIKKYVTGKTPLTVEVKESISNLDLKLD
jgi:hypothetical protein